jgi:glycosyltransferase involved in cell wall biosynthesis
MVTYNRSRYIREAVASVLPQLREHDELTIVDDGSTDNTQEVLQPYLTHAQVNYHRKEHTNAPDSRNYAISHSKNPWLVWLDSDDLLSPRALDIYRPLLNQSNEVDVYYGNMELFGDVGDHRRKLIYKNYFRENDHLLNRLFYSNVIPHAGSLIRKCLYDRVGGYDTRFDRTHDYELWIRCAKSAVFKHINSFTYLWRWHDKNMSSGSVVKDKKYNYMSLEKMFERYSLAEVFPFRYLNEDRFLARANMEIGRKCRQLGRHERALTYQFKSIDILPTLQAYLELLLIYFNHSHHLPADVPVKIEANYLQSAIRGITRMKGRSYWEKYSIASICRKLGRTEKAYDLFSQLMLRLQGKRKYEKMLSGIYFHLGEIDYLKNDYKNALKKFDKCLELNPQHMKAREFYQLLKKGDIG